jgi:hypothetical protein
MSGHLVFIIIVVYICYLIYWVVILIVKTKKEYGIKPILSTVVQEDLFALQLVTNTTLLKWVLYE